MNPDPPPPSRAVETDVYCIACGYNLRTLPAAGICPECARPVIDSLKAA